MGSCLHSEFKQEVLRGHPTCLSGAAQAALLVAQASFSETSTTTGRREMRRNIPVERRRWPSKLMPEEREKLSGERRCFACRKLGHMARECTEQRYPNAFAPVRGGVRLLATDVAPTTRARITLINRFSDLEQEEPEDQQAPMTAGQVTSSPTVSQAAHVSNAMTDGEHDLLLVQGKINGRRATMLIDSGSHDFISEDFVKRHSLATTSGPDDIRVTLRMVPPPRNKS